MGKEAQLWSKVCTIIFLLVEDYLGSAKRLRYLKAYLKKSRIYLLRLFFSFWISSLATADTLQTWIQVTDTCAAQAMHIYAVYMYLPGKG